MKLIVDSLYFHMKALYSVGLCYTAAKFSIIYVVVSFASWCIVDAITIALPSGA